MNSGFEVCGTLGEPSKLAVGDDRAHSGDKNNHSDVGLDDVWLWTGLTVCTTRRRNREVEVGGGAS